MELALFGGAFDPPHVGHVAVARAAKEQFDVERLIVLVAEKPAHKEVHLPVETRMELARAAFPDDEVQVDPYPRTIDLLRAESFDDPLFVIGADQFCDFLSWEEPDAVLGLAQLAVATRPGFPRDRLDAVLEQLRRPDRVRFFAIEPMPAASRDLRELAAAGAPLTGLVPDAVWQLIRERGLYGAS
ncbi:MAG: nicotinate-nicotinamide nucleotide adenylyltransferase [Actinomycetota bacterium]